MCSDPLEGLAPRLPHVLDLAKLSDLQRFPFVRARVNVFLLRIHHLHGGGSAFMIPHAQL
jgi:hypothetical protein